MSEQEMDIRATVERVLGRIAPEADLDALDPAEPLRDQLDIDSFDFLRFMIGLHEALGVDIPETDYPQMETLDSILSYLRSALGVSTP